MHINVFLLCPGHHQAAWRHSQCESKRLTQIGYYQELAQVAEQGCLDSIFIADALWHEPRSNFCGGLEPFTLLSALAVTTDRVGLIATGSTSYFEPFHLARMLASLDHISKGRAGWNIVVSNHINEARNFNLAELQSHDERYGRAEEFVTVVKKLWESWDPDAVIHDQETGHYTDPERIRVTNHEGQYFRVRGPLNIQRPPQGRPFLIQAGASDTGRDFAARHADAVFTVQQDLGASVRFRTDMRKRSLGRKVKVLPGICPIIGSTEAEAVALQEQLTALQVVDYGLEQLSMILNFDLTGRDIDGPLPWNTLPHVESLQGSRTRFSVVYEMRQANPTIREVIANLGFGRGHLIVRGTPEKIADVMEEWYDRGAADGFNIMPPILPTGLQDFVDQVVPIMQKRGLFRTHYETQTLRGHYRAAVK